MFSRGFFAWNKQALVPFSTALGFNQGHHESKYGSENEITEGQPPAMYVDSLPHNVAWRLVLNEYSYEEV